MGSGSNTNTFNIIEYNIIRNSNSYGIYNEYLEYGNTIRYNIIHDCASYGINSQSPVIIAYNTIYNCTSTSYACIYITYNSSVLIGNTIYNGGYGIKVNGARGLVMGNVINNMTRDGIVFLAGSDLHVVANRITNCGTSSTSYYGINTGAFECYVTNMYNVFYKNGTDGDGVHTHDVSSGVNTGEGSLAADNAAECGYIDTTATPPNFNLTYPAILRPGSGANQNVNVNIDGTNKNYMTAGLSPVNAMETSLPWSR
jgi:hypothetical protein